VAARLPAGLDVRGRGLWRALTTDQEWDPAGLLLVAEACRMADRLEKLDGLLRGDVSSWASIVVSYEGGKREVYLEMDGALGEARQLQGSLLMLLTKLGLGRSVETTEKGGDALDDLFAARRARLASTEAG